MCMRDTKEIIESLGGTSEILEELKEYLTNKFEKNSNIPEKMEKEEFILSWEDLLNMSKEVGIQKALNENMSHGGKDIVLKDLEGTKLEIYNSIEGPKHII